jgi:hypothetical protein
MFGWKKTCIFIGKILGPTLFICMPRASGGGKKKHATQCVVAESTSKPPDQNRQKAGWGILQTRHTWVVAETRNLPSDQILQKLAGALTNDATHG